MSGISAGHRGSQKRQRSGQPDVPASDPEAVRTAVTALLERLTTVRSNADNVRNEHLASIADIDEAIAAKQTAKRAVARVVPPPPSEDIAAFSRGVPASSRSVHLSDGSRPPLAAMKLLVEQDPPEKLIHEQSVIVRAQAINRKNAELARERLPKQPEAQRNKTHWDYVMDEALWLATDYREERKWKLRVAKSLAKAAATYHVQKELRKQRALKEERTRIRKLAVSVARDVKKFWSQVRELDTMRKKELEEIRLIDERRDQLNSCLQQAAKMTSNVAQSLRIAPQISQSTKTAVPTPGVTPIANPSAHSVVDEETKSTELGKSDDPSVSSPSVPSGVTKEASSVLQTSAADEPSADFDAKKFSKADIADDEETLDIAEAQEEKDPKETARLTAEADMTLEQLLESQGIDMASYTADNKRYLSDEEDSAEEDTVSSERSDEDSSAGSGDEAPNTSMLASDQGEKGIFTASGQRFVPAATSLPTGSRIMATERLPSDGKSMVLQPEQSKPDTVAQHLKMDSPNDIQQQHLTGVTVPVVPSATPVQTLNLTTKPVMNGEKQASPIVPSPRGAGAADGLLRGTLRSYQLEGMEWLKTLYKTKVNGILADEMGLGKTIQTIALLSWLAVEEGIWGPHLIIVPTSVMVNWEVEFKKWAPGFKILTYFGSLKERKAKRVGWSRQNTFHVCITSYALAVQDAAALRRKDWCYLILDEAHNIKNFQSQRWQTLLRFPSKRRLLLTGTPLQNHVMELWSLLHFLMPKMFDSQSMFKDWFGKSLGDISSEGGGKENNEQIGKLHQIIRPFMLRRLKRDVEKGLPPKSEHVQKCPLSKRQRQLYEDFLSRSETQNTLQSGDFFGVMGVLMQLRKVCNHPDLFEGRPILSPFAMKPVFFPVPAQVMKMKAEARAKGVDLSLLNLDLSTDELKGWRGDWHSSETERLSAVPMLLAKLATIQDNVATPPRSRLKRNPVAAIEAARRVATFDRSVLMHHVLLTSLKVRKRALVGEDVMSIVQMTPSSLLRDRKRMKWDDSFSSIELNRSLEATVDSVCSMLERFVCSIRKVTAPSVELRFAGDDAFLRKHRVLSREFSALASPLRTLLRVPEIRSSVTLPDARLVQWDCGKLQVLAVLLRKLKLNSSRVLIFSQMTKVLNILETFLNLHGHRYLRLDGSTKTGERQRIVERFNTDTRIFCMILTTRAGGVGLNLTGADTVIFYDTDYNPAIDAQAQDRVHRIGQKKPVHIYRLVCEKTVEENILRRANEKRTLESLVISEAGFNINSFQNRSALNDLVGVKPADLLRRRLPAPSMRNSAAVPSSAVQAKAAALPEQTPRGASNPAQSADVQKQRNGHASVPILGAHGHLQPLGWVEREAQHIAANGQASANGTEGHPSLTNAAEQSDAYHRLLAEEDGSGNQVHADIVDEDDFDDAEMKPAPGKEKAGSTPAFETVQRTLTPIQLFALKFIERGSLPDVPEPSPNGDPPDVEPDEDEDGATAAPATANGLSNGHADAGIDSDSDSEDLFYDQKISAHALTSSLKALTDTDVNIKLYLPLRDGGPEELKISSVVNGTAAAGLECAEDAAFFPHAYNRMSRTIYATKRQKEKAAANLRKREELEEKRKRELAKNASLRAGARGAAGSSGIVPSKSKQDLLKGSGMMKRPRADGWNRMRTPGMSPGPPGDGSFPGANGLFKKALKRTPRKVSTLYGKASINFPASAMFGEGLGNNDGWTVEEDKTVTDLTVQYAGNMALVADAMAVHPDVMAGNRRVRSVRHITDRWFNVIQKESKTGQTIKPATPGNVFASQNLGHFTRAAQKSSNSFHKLDVKSIEFSDMHASHPRVAQEAQKKPEAKFSSTSPPTFGTTVAKIAVPRGHLSGLKAHECTPQALNKKKVPFVRPPRNDSRSSVRGSGTTTPQLPPTPAGPSRGSASAAPTPTAKPAVPARSMTRMQPTFPPVGQPQARAQAAAAALPQRAAAPAGRMQNMAAGRMVPPGTTAAARMSFGQFGNSQLGGVRVSSGSFNVGSTVPKTVQRGRPAMSRGTVVNGAVPTAIRPTPAGQAVNAATQQQQQAKMGAVAQQRRMAAVQAQAQARKFPGKMEAVARAVPQVGNPLAAAVGAPVGNAVGVKVFQPPAAVAGQAMPAAKKVAGAPVVGGQPKAVPVQAANATVARAVSVVPSVLSAPLVKTPVGNSAPGTALSKPQVLQAPPVNRPAASVATTGGATARPVQTGLQTAVQKVTVPLHPVPQTIPLIAPSKAAKKPVVVPAAAPVVVGGNTSVAPSAVPSSVPLSVGGLKPPVQAASVAAANAQPFPPKAAGAPAGPAQAAAATTKPVENGIQQTEGTGGVSEKAKILVQKKDDAK